jgi:uncharacterized membrane protein YhhN
MPLLALAYSAANGNAPAPLRRLVLVDLLASCAGDTLLLAREATSFALGSAAFAVAHVAAILALARLGSSNVNGAIRRYPWLLAVFALAWVAPNLAIVPNSGALAFVVVPYSALLLAMAACALETIGRIPRAAAFPLALGALAFVESDSAIAFARFAPAFAPPRAEIVVIVFYLLAQTLIAYGFTRAAAFTRDGARTSAPHTA